MDIDITPEVVNRPMRRSQKTPHVAKMLSEFEE